MNRTLLLATSLTAITTTTIAAPVTCTVNGERVTDPARIEQHTREALQLADEILQIPFATLVSILNDSPAITRVGEMLNELTKER